MSDIKLECNFHLYRYNINAGRSHYLPHVGYLPQLGHSQEELHHVQEKKGTQPVYHFLKQEKAEVFKARLNLSNKIKIAIDSHCQRFVLLPHTQHT